MESVSLTTPDLPHLLREPVRGGVAYPGLAALPGMEQLGAFLAGRAPAPPVARLTGRRIIDASVGSATYALPATGWMVGPKGFVHPGVLAFLADAALIGTVVSALPARVLCTTAELSMTFLHAIPPGSEITAEGQLLHLDQQMALAEVYVRNAHGRLAAHGTSRCSVFPPIDQSVQLTAPDEPAAATEPGTPDPYLREPPAAQLDPPQDARDGLELLQGQLRGQFSRPPIDQLTGIRLVEAQPWRVVFALPASPWLRNEWGNVFGGILTLLAKSAAAAAVQSTATHGTSFTALDVKINFIRAVPADGHELLATGTVLHCGKRLAIATAEVMQGDDRVATHWHDRTHTAQTPQRRPTSVGRLAWCYERDRTRWEVMFWQSRSGRAGGRGWRASQMVLRCSRMLHSRRDGSELFQGVGLSSRSGIRPAIAPCGHWACCGRCLRWPARVPCACVSGNANAS